MNRMTNPIHSNITTACICFAVKYYYSSIGVINVLCTTTNKSKERHFQVSFSICTVNLFSFFKVQIKLNVMRWQISVHLHKHSGTWVHEKKNELNHIQMWCWACQARVKTRLSEMWNFILIFADLHQGTTEKNMSHFFFHFTFIGVYF